MVLEIIEDLVQRKANLNHSDQVTGRTPLTYACEYGISHEVLLAERKLQGTIEPSFLVDSGILVNPSHYRV